VLKKYDLIRSNCFEGSIFYDNDIFVQSTALIVQTIHFAVTAVDTV